MALDNLELLSKVREELNLSSEERRSFDSFLIGVLSNRLSEEQWLDALKTVSKSITTARAKA